MKIWIVFIGSGLGGSLRYALGVILPRWFGLPLPTLVCNLVASFALGYLVAYLAKNGREPDGKLWLFYAIGFCGGLSTYSGFTLELVQMGTSKAIFQAVFYSIWTYMTCILALWLGSKAA